MPVVEENQDSKVVAGDCWKRQAGNTLPPRPPASIHGRGHLQNCGGSVTARRLAENSAGICLIVTLLVV